MSTSPTTHWAVRVHGPDRIDMYPMPDREAAQACAARLLDRDRTPELRGVDVWVELVAYAVSGQAIRSEWTRVDSNGEVITDGG